MATLAGSVIVETQGLLNDPTGAIYPTQALIPILNKSYRELQTKLNALGISTSKEVNGVVPVPTPIDYLGDGAGLPTDFLYPIEIGERLLGSEDKFVPMDEREWEPTTEPVNELRYWTWREETLWFVGALTNRQLYLRYIKSLTPIAAVENPILITDSQSFLAQRTAALASLLLGHNPNRSNALMTDLYSTNGPWEDMKATKVKRLQNIPVRRRRTRYRVP
jgi:hypothetical protein